MGREHVELRVHMYHEPVGTRVTRVNEVCGVDLAGWSAEQGVCSGEVPPWVETESDWASAVFPETGETVDRVTGRPFPGRYWSSHDLRSPHTGYRLGNVTWKIGLKCRWVGGDDEEGEEDASLDVEQQQRWLMNHSWLCACALEAASACRISYMSKI